MFSITLLHPSLPLVLLPFHFLLLIKMAQNQNQALIKVAQHQDQVLTRVGLDQDWVSVRYGQPI